MFRLRLPPDFISQSNNGISLAEYQAAFLLSPLFRCELWLLNAVGAVPDRSTIADTNLMDVATGKSDTMATWKTWAVEGDRHEGVSLQNEPQSNYPNPCIIMRSTMNDRPFCDTWWAVEVVTTSSIPDRDQRQHIDLVFGTSLLNHPTFSSSSNSRSTGKMLSSILTDALTPLHRLYSRLLLASCQANLIQSRQERTKYD